MFLCEFSSAWNAKLNRRHIGFVDGNLPHRRRYLSIKICYYKNSDASYQLQRLVQSGDTGVSLNPGSTVNNYNEEENTQSSQSSIRASKQMPEYLALQYLLIDKQAQRYKATLIVLF